MVNKYLSFLLLSLLNYLGNSELLGSSIQFRVRNGYDGTVLTAPLFPSYGKDWRIRLENVTMQEWAKLPTQLWTLKKTGDRRDHYWMKPLKGVLNSLTGIPGEQEVEMELNEIAQNSGTFTIRNVERNECLENVGIGLPVEYKKCDEFNTAQQWDLENPNNLHKFHIRLINELLKIFS